eukprot:CAMPEP_0118963296 /NCGR_PEP_ID=MMETSP1173-20130426/1261_1 /TAXON_ID=1034831 /ORGANISM="Rhizochromulina marina cf, Strain CCMP1243" /LENGTH=365 /DNA_ID=CAMNT_0006911619 /DNA_START=119 /DNA_END=1219 /DNA_ORIENTATION=+
MAGEEDEALQPSRATYIIPFKRFPAADRHLSQAGTCIQGHHGWSTHKDTLAYAVDFRLPEGTPILASRRGVVAACADHFRLGGVDQVLRPRANFVAIQHEDGTYARYFHLKHQGVKVAVGEEVEAGDRIGLSGNTGYSSTPHLHFDVVDILPEDTAFLEFIVHDADGSSPCAAKPEFIPAIMAAFSVPLTDQEAIHAEVILADPPDARAPLNNADLVHGRAVLVERGGCSFETKTRHALAAGATCILVANHNDGPELFCMGGSKVPVPVPTALISKESGCMIKEAIQSPSCRGEVTLRNSEGYGRARRNLHTEANGDGNRLMYSTQTLSVPFTHEGLQFIPQEGRNYPPARGTRSRNARACCAVM